MASGVRITDFRVTEIHCHRCDEKFPRPRVPLTLDALRCPRCGNLRGNVPQFTLDEGARKT